MLKVIPAKMEKFALKLIAVFDGSASGFMGYKKGYSW